MKIDIKEIRSHGNGLNRPECVLTHCSGLIFVPDWTGSGGVSIIHPTGTIQRILSTHDFPIRPNGIALESDGSFLLAHLGATSGGIFRLKTNGAIETVANRINGQCIPPTNFVTIDSHDRIWITVSTTLVPRSNAYRRDVKDGFIATIQGKKIEIVAENLGYTNECLVAEAEQTLYVNETFSRRLSAFSIRPNGKLGPRKTVTHFGAGTYPDGLCQDQDGNLWVTSIISNRLLRISQDGRVETVIEDCDHDHLEQVEKAYLSGTMIRSHLDTVESKKLKNISSLAFGGESLDTGYLGCLLDNSIYQVDLGVKGVPGHGWNADVSTIDATLFF